MSGSGDYIWGLKNTETGRLEHISFNREGVRKYRQTLVNPVQFILKRFTLSEIGAPPKVEAEPKPKIAAAASVEINTYSVIADAIHTGIEGGVRHALKKMPQASVIGPSTKEIAETNFLEVVDQAYIHAMNRLTEILVFEK